MNGLKEHNHKPILIELVDAWNAHDAERVASCYAPDYIGTDAAEPNQQCGPTGVAQAVRRYLNAFPDLTLVQTQTVLGEDDAAIQMTVRGTHQGSIMHIPASGRRTSVQGVAFLKFDHDRIIHASYLWDVAGFLRSIGLLPDL